MGMTTYLRGVKPADEKWRAMRNAWRACDEAGIEPPKEVRDFFGDEEPDDAGVVVTLAGGYGNRHEAVSRINRDMVDGYEVDLRKLPPDIVILRFENSY